MKKDALRSKLLAGLALAALLASDLSLAIAPTRAQSLPANAQRGLGAPANGPFGLSEPGVSPYPGTPGLQPPLAPQQVPHQAPRPRVQGPVAANLCQPGRVPPPAPVARTQAAPPGASPLVTQVTVTQAVPQAGADPRDLARPPATPQPGAQPQPAETAIVEGEELSRIEASYNVDGLQLFGFQPAAAPGQPAAASGQPGVPPTRTQPGAYPTTSPATPLRQFGYSMFAATVSTFAPVDDIPVGPDYILGPGDDLTINVWGAVDSTIVRTVDRNGRIVLPKVGDLRLWGLTFSQADRLIREQLARYFRGFQTSVTMGRLRTVHVHVVGEVCQPGVYTLSPLSTVTNALFSAGGPTKLGTLRDVRLLRSGHQVARLDLYDFLLRGDRSRDYRLESGDTIFVPTIGDVVAITGEVKRPSIYELRGAVRLADLVDMAGGVTPSSYLKRVQIVRARPSAERVTADVDLSQFYLKGDLGSNPPVNAGDLVLIHRSDPRVYNTIKVEGAVKYPGAYELKPLMRISQLLPPEKLLPEAYTERVEVSRRRPDLTIEIVAVNLAKAWRGDADQDLMLKPLDEVAVRTELRPARAITLGGQVVRPGVYTIAEGERLASVLERAGGFTDRAFLKGAVFTRAALRKTEQEQLDAFVRTQEQRMLAAASTVVVGADKEEVQGQQAALQARREALRMLAARVVVGRMVVRLNTPGELRGTPDDIVLVDGDTLQVPEPPASVMVLGAVRTSTSVLFKGGEGVDYYINRVGGYAKEADKKDVHIVRADGSAVSSFTNVRTLEPGDTIIVPPKEEEKIRTLPTVRDIVQTVGQALLGLAALAVLF